MPNVNPTHEDLMEALEKKRARRKRQRAVQTARWQKRGAVVMTLELAREIRDFKDANPDLTHREIGERFNVSIEKVGRVLRHTIFPER